MEFYCLEQSAHKFCGQTLAPKVLSFSLEKLHFLEQKPVQDASQVGIKCLLFLDYTVRTDSLI